MTANEERLIEIIRSSNDPTAAIMIATQIIVDFLAQPQSFEESYLASLEEQA